MSTVRPRTLIMAVVLGSIQVCAAQMFNNIKDLVHRISPRVVTILSFDKDGQLFGYGSGFVVKANGLIASNYHVIKGAHVVNVKMYNGDTFDVAGIVDIDPSRDFVILKIAGYDLPAVTFGNSNNVEIGDPVIAIGNPQGLEHTVSNGIVSQQRRYEGFTLLQITVPISQGSSGGPLVNMNGEVIGMTTLTMQEGQNLNFALPINYIRGALENNSAAKYTLAEVTAWQDQQDAQELERKLDKLFAVYQDPDDYFSIAYPRTWKAYRSEGWEKDRKTFHKVTIFVPPEAHRAEVNGYISEGVRIHFQVPEKGKMWALATSEKWGPVFMSKMIQSNPGFVITDSMVTAFGKFNAKVYSMVGQNSNIPEPEKTIFILLATKKCRLIVELVSPTSTLSVNNMIHAALIRTFRYSEKLMQ